MSCWTECVTFCLFDLFHVFYHQWQFNSLQTARSQSVLRCSYLYDPAPNPSCVRVCVWVCVRVCVWVCPCMYVSVGAWMYSKIISFQCLSPGMLLFGEVLFIKEGWYRFRKLSSHCPSLGVYVKSVHVFLFFFFIFGDQWHRNKSDSSGFFSILKLH